MNTTAIPGRQQGGYNKGEVQQVTLTRANRLRSRLAIEIGMVEERIFNANTTPNGQESENVPSLLAVRDQMTQALADLDTSLTVAYAGNQGEGVRLLNAVRRSRADATFFATLPTPRGTYGKGEDRSQYNAQLGQTDTSNTVSVLMGETDTIIDQLQTFEFRTQVSVPTRVVNSSWWEGFGGGQKGHGRPACAVAAADA